jgi:hypothetical protein
LSFSILRVRYENIPAPPLCQAMGPFFDRETQL